MKRIEFVLWAGLVLAVPMAAAGFEGTVKMRTVEVDRSQLGKVTGGTEPDAQQIMQITGEQLLGAKDAGVQERDSTIYVAGSKVRMDAPAQKGKGGFVIVDTSKDTTLIVMPSEKRYMEMTAADVKEMGDKMGQMVKMMKDRMAQVPPEQRAQVEAMLKKMTDAEASAEAPPVEPKPLGKTQTIDGMEATAYEAKSGDETMIMWVSQAQPELAKALLAVQERIQQLAPPQMRRHQATVSSMAAKGFPVLTQVLTPQKYRVEQMVTIDQKPVEASLFSVPADYTKISAGDAMKGSPAGQGVPQPKAVPPSK